MRREFTDSEKVPRQRGGRHQVAELPPTAVGTGEHRTQSVAGPDATSGTRATLGIVGESAFGRELGPR